MKEPNIIPAKPEFHRIQKQECIKEDKLYYRVNLDLTRLSMDDLPEPENATFLIPISACDQLFTVFKLGLHPTHGWTLLYKENQKITVQKTKEVEYMIHEL